jgi:hypothetical protein
MALGLRISHLRAAIGNELCGEWELNLPIDCEELPQMVQNTRRESLGASVPPIASALSLSLKGRQVDF